MSIIVLNLGYMRKHWIDNLRWFTVLMVLFYHVIYFFNNKGVFGGIGGFGPYFSHPQYQDIVMYILYPFFMPLLFLLAGISARYALEKKTAKEWFKARTRKLLVPGTIGLFVFHWMVGYFNTLVAGKGDIFQGLPGPVNYIIMAISGTGPLWFIQVLWLLCLVLLLVRAIDKNDKFWNWCGKMGLLPVILLGILLYLGSFTLIRNPRPESADGLLNLYKPLYYMIPFLLGYFVFSHDEIIEMLGKVWYIIGSMAFGFGVALITIYFGRDNTSPEFLQSPLNSVYGWMAILGLIGTFKALFDRTSKFATYMTRSSFGIYIVHYLVIASLGYMMKTYTQLPPWSMYVILTVAVFTLSPLLYEGLHRIPFVRWCVFGEKR